MTFTVTITGVSSPIEIYAGLPAVQDYLVATFGTGPAIFLALTSNEQSKTLVSATRYIDAQPWRGAAELAGTTLQFPRSGLTDAAGAPVSDAAQLARVGAAVAELCALIAIDPAVLAARDTSSNIQAANAGGGTGVTFFNPTSVAFGTASVLPTAVDRLLGQWLDAPGGAIAGHGQSGGCETAVNHRNVLDRVWPF